MHAMEILLCIFMLAMCPNLQQSFSLGVSRVYPHCLLASNTVVDKFNANMISDTVQVVLFFSLRVSRIFILP